VTSQPELILPWNTPSKLKADPLLRRLFVQYVDDWILREAEKWDHPWQFLLGVRGLPLGCYDFFKAAVSVSIATEKLVHMTYRGATLSRNLSVLQARANRNECAAQKAAVKLFRAQYKHGFWQTFKSEKERIQFEQLREKEDKRLCKQHGRNWRTKFVLPSREESEKQSPAAYFMVHSWLRCGFCNPGLCFFSDKALADFLSLLWPNVSASTEYYRKIRQRLGLKQLYHRKPSVTAAYPVLGTELIEITLQTPTGEHQRQLSARDVCTLGGRQCYPIPVAAQKLSN
jgi:hypothetical protein